MKLLQSCEGRIGQAASGSARSLCHLEQQQQERKRLQAAVGNSQQSAGAGQPDISDGLWLFGEVPASSSTDTLARAASAAFHGGSSSQWSAQTASQGYEQQAVQAIQVVLEVLAGPPVVPQLSKANGALRIRRRLPSQEAIRPSLQVGVVSS